MDNLPTQIFEDKTRQQVDGSLPDDEKIEGFVASQVIQRGLDKRTANAYRFDLQQIYLWLGEQRIPILEESAAEDYLEYLIKEKKRKPSTVIRKYRVLQYYLEYLFKQGCLESYRKITPPAAKIQNTKTRHCGDYFSFMSHLFLQMGYHGWVILIDETELMGRLGKKARLNAYRNMAQFLLPEKCPESAFTIFALSASYTEDVIEGKHEYENLEAIYPNEQEPIKTVLDLLVRAPQLLPLTKEEVNEVLCKIQDFHGRAYGWTPNLSVASLAESTQAGGYLLRTKIRAAIEFLDQLYQYGKAGKTIINELGEETFAEDVPEIEDSE